MTSETKKALRVKIELLVEVDAEQWANEYDIALEDVREDVKGYVCHWAENTTIPLTIIKTNQKAAVFPDKMKPETEAAFYAIQKSIAEAGRTLNRSDYYELLVELESLIGGYMRHEEQRP